MRSLLCVIGICLTGLAAQAQEIGDSIRVATLETALVTAKQKTQQERLYHFFNANKAATTEDILSRLPELSLVRRGSYGMDPMIRAFTASQINVLVDGMRIHSACTDRMDPATIYIEPVNLQSLQVNTGGASLLQGSSVGGSLNLKLAEAVLGCEPLLSGSVSSGYQSAARAFYEAARIGYSSHKWGVRASGAYRKSGDYRAGGGQKIPYSSYEKANYSLSGAYLLNDSWRIKASILADDGWNIGYPALPMDAGYANARIASLGIIKENAADRWNFFEARLYGNKVKHFMDDSRRENVPMPMDMPGLSATWGAFAEGRRQIDQRSQLTLRADGSSSLLSASMTMRQEGQPEMFMLTLPDVRIMQSALAAGYLLQLDSLSALRFHARGDITRSYLTSQMGRDQLKVFGYEDDRRYFILPAVSVSYTRKLAGSLQATIGGVVNGRAPSANELYGFYLFNQFDGFDYVGNADLKAERSVLAEMTIAWQQPKIRWQLSGYYSGIHNYILGIHDPAYSVMTIGAKGVKQYRNVHRASLTGAEASMIYRPFANTQLMATLKYSYGKDDQGKALPMIAPLRSIGSLRQQLGQFSIQAEWEVAAPQRRVSAAAAESPTSGFSIAHLRAGYKIERKSISWQVDAGVENLFDTAYREHLDWGKILRPGRNLFVQLTLAF